MHLSSSIKDPDLVPVGKGIYLRRAPPFTSTYDALKPLIAPNSFSIILIFGWMGAKLPHIFKYTKVYEDVFPNATQVIITSNPQLFWSSNRTRMKNLLPVMEILEAHGCSGTLPVGQVNEAPRILVHCFSNGGGVQLLTLGNLLRSKWSLDLHGGHVSAMVIDSCPGTPSLWRTVQAFCIFLPTLLRIPTVILVTFVYGIITLIKQWVFGVQPISERLKEGLLRKGPQGGILPWMNEQTPRMYVCSKKDDLIPIDQIEEHVKEARRRGLNVKIEMYEDTPHVAHARSYPERYWGAVKDLWVSADSM
ncbi:hypothetical protein C8R41DRAFT_806573 [Lentinula lateritia]|uniref:Indole-diterpene biosynthesis protein PaxU n=1 Tax=Lentinula lateritia TaxID=40482 RepID=A0ABQ8W223_9AGAR|nr:hypothetical protein C8R41DRAFT_806573 [Lentinula lateritia]